MPIASARSTDPVYTEGGRPILQDNRQRRDEGPDYQPYRMRNLSYAGTFRNPVKATFNSPERILAIVQRQIGEIDIHGQAWKITDKEVNCRATFQRKAGFGGNQR